MIANALSPGRALPQVWNGERALAASLVGILLLQASLVATRAINWDEYFYYSEVWAFAQEGTLNRAIQTLHVRLFGWVTFLPGDTVDHIRIARIFMFGCELVTLGSIFAIARRFGSREAAIICALAYVSFGYVIQHGFAFRTDPIATAALALSLAIFACKDLRARNLLLIALPAAFAFAITIKSVLWAPAFAAMAFRYWQDADYSSEKALRILGLGLLTGAAALVLIVLHGLDVPAVQASDTGASVGNAADKMFSLSVNPYWKFFGKGLLIGLPTFVMVAASLILIARGSVSKPWLFALLLSPLACLVFYQNTLPYFYVFMMAPVCAGLVPAAEWLSKNRKGVLVAVAMFANAAAVVAVDDRSTLARQKEVHAAERAMFERPVKYFDFPDMFARQDKANGFMTAWGLDGYLRSGEPFFTRQLQEQQVPLVVENGTMWTSLLRERGPAREFHPVDAEVLRDTFIHAWGPFWLAGWQSDTPATIRWKIRVPGEYEVLEGKIELDGKPYDTGDRLYLDRGPVTVRSTTVPAKLIWAEGVSVPETAEPELSLWTLF
ncbi:hypothetical protein [Qipengyuania sp. JC766]|uniref:hypothetical protein n=1 Tax=Qipengyuania sp. JC766 TaxID=3232139 RepID=UPI00345ADEE0